MFRDFINQPVDPIPQAYVDTLCRPENEPDYTLTSLGVAMLRPRVEKYSGIKGVYLNFEKKANCIHDFVARNFEYGLTFCYYTYSIDECDDKFINEKLADYSEKKNIRQFVKEQANIDCQVFVHKNKDLAVVFINKREMRFYHLMMTFVSLYFPKAFKEHPMTEIDYKLVKTFSKKEKDPFVACIQEMVAPYIPEFRKLQLGFLINEMHQVKIRKAKQDVDNQRAAVEDFAERYSNAIETLKNFIVIYEGMMATQQKDDTEEEFVEYLSENKCIRNLEISGNNLCFSVATILNNYNEAAWETFSKRGSIYDGNYKCTLPEIFKDQNNRKLVLDSIFSENPKLLVKIAGNYKVNLDRCRVSTDKYYNYVDHDPLYKSYIPNPHLKLFGCLGGYEGRVANELYERNYIGAVEMCIASAGSVDLDETEQTFRPFLGWILSSKEKILRTKDGLEMTPEEALVWLIDKEKEK